MNPFYIGDSYISTQEEPVIRDIINEFSEDDDVDDLPEDGGFTMSSLQKSDFNNRSRQISQYDLSERMTFPNKEATLVVIKQYHIAEGFKFVVVGSKTDQYVARCIDYNNGCQWRLRASFSKIRDTWEIKNIEAPHTCLSTTLSDDHVNLDSNQIATVVVNSIKANPSIPMKSLIAEIKSHYGYSVTYKKAWMTTFERTKSWFVERGTKIECMLRASHQYPEDITALLRKNEQQSAMCHVQSYNRQNPEFDVQELSTAQLQCLPMPYTVRLND